MACIVELEEGVRFNFVGNILKQKIWIEAIMYCFNKDIDHIATLLDITAEKLAKVHHGVTYLSESDANKLGQLFLITFSD